MVGPLRAVRFCAFAAGLFLLPLSSALAQDRLAELRARFSQQNDPVRKAKVLSKLGQAEIELLRKEVSAGQYAEALRLLEEHREEVKATYAALKQSGINPEKKPGGFKDLQIHLRKTSRQLRDAILILPYSQREPFHTIRGELEEMESELIDMLFPRQPGKSPEERKRKG